MKVDIHKEDARGNVLATLAGTRFVFRGKRFRVPAGFESDGASVPRLFWTMVCPPLDHHAVRAGVAHDYIYREQPPDWTRKEADKMFLCFLIEDGLPPLQARLAYWGVRLGGWIAWKENRKQLEAETRAFWEGTKK